MCYSLWYNASTSCNTQSSVPEDGQNNCPKHVKLTGIINKPLLLHLVGCLYYLYQWCTVKQISDNEIYLLIKYIKSVVWRVAKRLSYIEDARCLKVNVLRAGQNHVAYNCTFFSSFLIFFQLRSKYSSQHPVLEHPQFSSLIDCERQSFHPFNAKSKFILIYVLIFVFLESNRQKIKDRTATNISRT